MTSITSQFTTDIQHIKGEDNPVANTLSQLSAIHCDNIVNFQDIAKAQSNGNKLSLLQTSNPSLKLQATPAPTSEETFFVTSLRDYLIHSFQPNSVVIFLIHYIPCLILASEPLNA